MLGKKDMRILHLLQEDSRMPLAEIARDVRMSENGVRYRLKKMESLGIIKGYTVLIEPRMLGKETTALLNIDVEPKEVEESIRRMAEMPELVSVFQTTGEHTIMAMGIFDSMEVMDSFLNRVFLKKIPVKDYTVNLIIRKCKESIFTV